MKSTAKWAYIATALLASAATAAPAARAETQIVLVGNLIADADSGPTGPATITVKDGRIESIAKGNDPVPVKPGVRVIDMSTKTVLPGLIDLHVHLSSDPGGDFWREATDSNEDAVVIGAKNARITALAGFTTVRDLGAPPGVGQALRKGTAEGSIAGPRIQTAGLAISIIGGHGDVSGFRPEVNAALDGNNTCTGANECAARVREASKKGVDLIKITATGGVLSQQARGLEAHFTAAEMSAIVDTAHSLGLKVAAHAHGARGIEAAAKAGVDTIEHCTFADDAAIAMMKSKGTGCAPTLMAFTGIRDRLGKGIYTPQVEAKVRQTLAVVGKAAAAMRKQGVNIVFGTDSGVYEHGRNAEELGQMVDLIGMTPREALASATTAAAKAMNLENDVGRIAPGYSADMIAVDGNPLENIRTLEKVKWVMVRGRIIN